MYKVICLVGVIPRGKDLDRLPCWGTYLIFYFLQGVLLFVLTLLFQISPYSLQLCILNKTRVWLLLFFPPQTAIYLIFNFSITHSCNYFLNSMR